MSKKKAELAADCNADYSLEKRKLDRGIHVGVGVSVAPGVDGVKSLLSLKLGSVILTKLPLNKDEALAVANFCREHKVYFIFSELLWRGTFRLCWAANEERPRRPRQDRAMHTSEKARRTESILSSYA